MGALRHSINEAWDIEDRPPLVQRKALDVALILGGTAILALSVSLTATHRLANVLDDEGDGGWLLAALLDVAGDVLPIVFLALGLLFLYRVLPMHSEPLRDIWPGALRRRARPGRRQARPRAVLRAARRPRRDLRLARAPRWRC